MSLQELFYLVGIIFMLTMMLVLIGIGFTLFYTKRTIDNLHHSIEQKIEDLIAPVRNFVKKVTEFGSLLFDKRK